MALETWLIKLKKTVSKSFNSVRVTPPAKTPVIKKTKIGVLAFEIAVIIPKLTHMWFFLSDENINHLHNHSICVEGVRKIVSNKDAFLVALASAELVQNLRVLAVTVSRISMRCEDSSLRCFESVFDGFANTGHDPYGWILNSKDMDAMMKKMERYDAATTTLYKAMNELSVIESNLKKSLHCVKKIYDLQQKVIWKQEEVKYAKEKSLWNKSFDSVTLLLATSMFTILSRIKMVFGNVYPSDQTSSDLNLVLKSANHEENSEISHGFFETNSKMLTPTSNTLGFAALSLHYANLIIVMEKMIRSPQLVGVDARDDLYSMLPNSIRSLLRKRLKGIGFTASDPVLAGEWREALGKILGWLLPLAHNMIKWQNERSFEHQNFMPKTNVLLLQTLFFANREKTEAAITELLVGLNYIWRFEREMNGKALFSL